ncbi:MAG: hypothetical protein J7J21_04200 [Methanomicrobia archaeon]|nr:hypothetical protein [Methanomicrobia archaeon]
MKIRKSIEELQKMKFNVRCPKCGEKIRFKEEIDLEKAFNNPETIQDEFDSTLFRCSCGNEFFGAETKESELIDELIEIFNELKEEGKISYENGVFSLDIGIMEGLKYLKKLKTIGEKYDRGDIFE